MTKYIDVCRGEIRITLRDGKVSISGGPMRDEAVRMYTAYDGLAEKMEALNARLSDCIEAREAMERQWPEMLR